MLVDSYANFIYTLFFVFVYFVIFFFDKVKVKKSQFCFFIGLLLSLGLALRSLDQGLHDTQETYLPMFKLATNYSWSFLYSSIICKYTSALFVTLMKCISIILFGNFRLFIIVCACFFVFSYEFLFYKCCHNVMLANLLFVAFAYPYGFFLIRQCLAMSFIALAIYFIYNKKIVSSIISCIVAMLFHTVSLVFIVSMVLSYLLLEKLHVKTFIIKITILIMTVLILVSPGIFSNLLQWLPKDSKYSMLLNLNLYTPGDVWIIPLLVHIVISVFLLYWYRKNSHGIVQISVISTLLSLMFVTTTNIVQDMIRISYYFFIPSILLISNSFDFKSGIVAKRKSSLIYGVLIIAVVLYAFVITLPANNIIMRGIIVK